VIITFRELAVTLFRMALKKKSIVIAADIWGKLKTVFQMIGIISALFFYMLVQKTPFLHDWEVLQQIPYVLEYLSILCAFESEIVFYIQIYFWFVTALTIFSGVHYFLARKAK
jgi:CDP-diacylglycerol--glycerol-3-phosphate 3-phosphatidyltransferase